MLTSAIVLVLTCGAFLTYELVTIRERAVNAFEMRARIVAAMSTATLAFDDPSTASEILSAIKVDPRIMAVALYDTNGVVFAAYPTNRPGIVFPDKPADDGHYFINDRLEILEPVTENAGRLGTLYLVANLDALRERFRLYGGIVVLVLLGSLTVAYILSRGLQKRISDPIVALVEASRSVSQLKDYSVRAPKMADDELGTLTDAFNHMLVQIDDREAALRENAERLQLALDASRTGTWDYNLQTGRITWDAFLYKLFGVRPGEFHGTYEHFLSMVHPEDRPHVTAVMRSAMDKRMEFVLEFRVSWPDGSVHYMASRGKAFYDEKGTPLRMTGVIMDVTQSREAEEARRRSEELLRALVETAVDGIVTFEEAGNLLTVNAAAETIFGYDASELTGKNVSTLMRAPVPAAAGAARQAIGVDGLRLAMGSDRELHGVRKDGTIFPLELAVSETHLKSGRIFTGIVRDITERKRAEEEIRRLNTELEERVRRRTAELAETNQELEAFTYSVSHDLRAPLRHIDGYAQVLQDDFTPQLPEQAIDYLRRIRRGTQNMGQLVDDLLHFARLGRQELNRRPTELLPIVNEVIADLHLETEGRVIEFVISELPVVSCDPALIRQVFANLLANAIKYTRPRSHAKVEVGWRKATGEIYVRDNGVGFNMKYANKLFGVFQRLHRVDEFEGTGVGLAMVDRIIRKHGGKIWAEAELDKGATFHFTLGSTVPEDGPGES